jgi:hypothetical protein
MVLPDSPLSGKSVKKEAGHEEGQQHFEEADKLLQEFQEGSKADPSIVQALSLYDGLV